MYLRALGITQEELTWPQIEALVADRTRESQFLDFKDRLPTRDAAAYKKLARHVSAFANAQGGLIVFGIKDENDHAAVITPVPLGQELASALKAVNAYLHPPVLGLAIRTVPCEAGDVGVVVLKIPPSQLAPHAVQEDQALSYWRRSGSDRHAMSEPDVERAYRARWSLREQAWSIRDRLLDSIAQFSTKAGAIGIGVSVTQPSQLPLYASPGDGARRLNELRNVLRRSPLDTSVYGSELGHDTRVRFRAVEGGNWTGDGQGGEEQFSTWWCRVDQAGGFALARAYLDAGPADFRRNAPEGLNVNQRHLLTPWVVETSVLSFMTSLRDLCRAYEAGGIASGILSLSSQTCGLPLVTDGSFSQMIGTSWGKVKAEFELAVDELFVHQSLLALARDLIIDTYSAFGLATEPEYLRADGAGRLGVKTAGSKRWDLRAWCETRGLPVLD